MWECHDTCATLLLCPKGNLAKKDLLQLLKGSHVVRALAAHEEEWKSIEVSLGKLFCVQHWTVGPRPLTYQLAIQDCITNMDLDLWKIHSSNTFAWRAKRRPPNTGKVWKIYSMFAALSIRDQGLEELKKSKCWEHEQLFLLWISVTTSTTSAN